MHEQTHTHLDPVTQERFRCELTVLGLLPVNFIMFQFVITAFFYPPAVNTLLLFHDRKEAVTLALSKGVFESNESLLPFVHSVTEGIFSRRPDFVSFGDIGDPGGLENLMSRIQLGAVKLVLCGHWMRLQLSCVRQ